MPIATVLPPSAAWSKAPPLQLHCKCLTPLPLSWLLYACNALPNCLHQQTLHVPSHKADVPSREPSLTALPAPQLPGTFDYYWILGPSPKILKGRGASEPSQGYCWVWAQAPSEPHPCNFGRGWGSLKKFPEVHAELREQLRIPSPRAGSISKITGPWAPVPPSNPEVRPGRSSERKPVFQERSLAKCLQT